MEVRLIPKNEIPADAIRHFIVRFGYPVGVVAMGDHRPRGARRGLPRRLTRAPASIYNAGPPWDGRGGGLCGAARLTQREADVVKRYQAAIRPDYPRSDSSIQYAGYASAPRSPPGQIK